MSKLCCHQNVPMFKTFPQKRSYRSAVNVAHYGKTLRSCRFNKEDSVGAGPKNMLMNLFLMAQFAGQSQTKWCSSSAEPEVQKTQCRRSLGTCCAKGKSLLVGIQVCFLIWDVKIYNPEDQQVYCSHSVQLFWHAYHHTQQYTLQQHASTISSCNASWGQLCAFTDELRGAT